MNSTPSHRWRRLDAFTKARSDIEQQKSLVGGMITVFAIIVTTILFVLQLYHYIFGITSHSLLLSQPIHVPLIPLEENVLHDGASLSSGELDHIHGYHTIVLREPTYTEMKRALNSGTSKSSPTLNTKTSGCTVIGQLHPLVVAGTVAITYNYQAWTTATSAISMMNYNSLLSGNQQNNNHHNAFGSTLTDSQRQMMQQYNVSHYVHKIEFGRTFHKQTYKPLENVRHIVENEFFGIGIVQTQVKLVPTTLAGSTTSSTTTSTSTTPIYQSSAVDITIQPRTLVAQGVQQLPGLVVSYDFTPLTVHHSEGRDNIFVFISSLISIVGGVYVTVSMLTGCLVHSAQAVAKKID